MRFHVVIDAWLDADGIDDAMRLMQAELDPDKDDTNMQPGSVIDIRPDDIETGSERR